MLSIIALGFGLFGCAAKEEVPVVGTTTAAPYGVAGNGYSTNLGTTCGIASLPWTVSSGALPTGLSFNGATGEVAGIPTVAGNSTVVFAATDSTGKTENCSVLFMVHPRTDRVSIDTNGNSVAGTNKEPSISRTDGRFIAFTSTASTLIAGVVGQQIYVHDRQTGQPSLVSKDNFGSAGIGGVSSAASVSADGRFVAFVSTATNLVPGVSGLQIYLHDTVGNVTSLVSQDNSGGLVAGTAVSSTPSISADGRFVAFVSQSTNLLGPAVPAVLAGQVYVRDTLTNLTRLVSQDNSGGLVPGIGLSSTPSISADGRFVAFVSSADNLVTAPPRAAASDVYVRAIP